MDLSAPEAQERIKKLREWRGLVKINPARYRVQRNDFYVLGFHLTLQELRKDHNGWNWYAIDGFRTAWQGPGHGDGTYEHVNGWT